MPKLSIGSKIDRMFDLRAEIAADQAKVDKKKERLSAMKLDIIEDLQKSGLDSGRGKLASASLTTAERASVKDWDKFYSWIYKNKAAHMLFRRVSDPAYREILKGRHGRAIPGVESFEDVTLNLRKRTS